MCAERRIWVNVDDWTKRHSWCNLTQTHGASKNLRLRCHRSVTQLSKLLSNFQLSLTTAELRWVHDSFQLCCIVTFFSCAGTDCAACKSCSEQPNISKSLLMQPLTALSLWMWVQSRNRWQSSGMENGQKTNIMSPNVDVSCVAVEKRGQWDVALSSATGDGSDSGAGKAGEPCKVSAAPSFIGFGLQVHVLFYEYAVYISTECSENQAEEDRLQNGHIAVILRMRVLSVCQQLLFFFSTDN